MNVNRIKKKYSDSERFNNFSGVLFLLIQITIFPRFKFSHGSLFDSYGNSDRCKLQYFDPDIHLYFCWTLEWALNPKKMVHNLHFSNISEITVADPGFSWGGPTPKANLLFCNFLPKTGWEWKNLDPEQGAYLVPPSPLDPPMDKTGTAQIYQRRSHRWNLDRSVPYIFVFTLNLTENSM